MQKQKFEIGEKFLISTDQWFVAPDGNQYKAVFGTVKAIETDSQTLGIKTNDRSTNWYVIMGDMMIAGCQIHYVIKTDEFNKEPPKRAVEHDGKLSYQLERITIIYNADGDSAEGESYAI